MENVSNKNLELRVKINEIKQVIQERERERESIIKKQTLWSGTLGFCVFPFIWLAILVKEESLAWIGIIFFVFLAILSIWKTNQIGNNIKEINQEIKALKKEIKDLENSIR